MAQQSNGDTMLPNSNAANSKSQNQNNQNAPSPAPGQAKRNHRNRKNHTQSMPQIDGAVSDSVAHSTAGPRGKRQQNPRQGATIRAASIQNDSMGKTNGQKPRPVSVGGPTLPGTPAKEQAYAGPTFQASPAPSSLPVPKFFSRSVPNVADQTSLLSRMTGENSPRKEQRSPGPDVVAPVARETHQSPLDLFFQADRAEKDRTRSAGHLSPQSAAQPRVPGTEPRNLYQSGKGAFLRELNDDGGDMPSPRTAPPKVRPQLTERSHSSPGDVPQSPPGEQQREAYTQSLKDLLFNNIGAPAPSDQTNSPPPQFQQRAQPDARMYNTPRHQQAPSGPSSPESFIDQRNQYSLHYGNRNLSPLFKAARNETPPGPSGLRQELPGNASFDPVPQPPRAPQNDAHDFTRNYLNEQIRSSHPGMVPNPPFTNGFSGAGPPQRPPHNVQNGNTSSGSPRSGNDTRDVRSMEDDLRRMLKLDVLG